MRRRLTQWWHARRETRERLALERLTARYHAFRVFLENNGRALELIGAIDGVLDTGGAEGLNDLLAELHGVCGEMVDGLNMVSDNRYPELYEFHGRLGQTVAELAGRLERSPSHGPYCLSLDAVEPAMERQTGAKAANLARLRRLGLTVPDGFVVTTHACRAFLEAAGLTEDAIGRRLGPLVNDSAALSRGARAIQDEVKRAALPEDLVASLLAAWNTLAGDQSLAVSVRSSGVAEDRAEHSFAGQYVSILNVTAAGDLAAAFREVVAGAFSPRAVAYRIRAGLAPAEAEMAVLCQRMVDARCAGVLFTRDPAAADSGQMLISAVPGLGTGAVGGTTAADIYRPARPGEADADGPPVIAEKATAEVAAPQGGLRQIDIEADQSRQPLLNRAQLEELVRCGQLIETIAGQPQDIEWAFDHGGGLHLLQARPVRLMASGQPLPPAAGEVLLASGVCACPGRAIGRVVSGRSADRLAAIPETDDHPRILLLAQAMVDAAPRLQDFDGVIVERGNPADHLSCIAREYCVPMVTALASASALEDGRWVVLDAERGKIFAAPRDLWRHGGPVHRPRSRASRPSEQPADPLRNELRQRVVPLHLTDAFGPTFNLRQCRSVHDLVRLMHELTLLAMFEAGDDLMEQAGALLKRVDLDVPFHFLVIDLGGGLAAGRKNRVLRDSDIRCVPLAALCRGLSTPGLSWHAPPPAAALGGLFSRTLLDGRSPRPAGSFNYAVATGDYLNLNSRVEYHFAMLDTVCGDSPMDNYIRFRFKGGGTGQARSRRRALFLCRVLEANGFAATAVADLVTASLVGGAKPAIEQRLVMMGRLLGFSRLLDAVMDDDQTPQRLADAFLAGRFDQRVAEAAAGSTPA